MEMVRRGEEKMGMPIVRLVICWSRGGVLHREKEKKRKKNDS